MVTYFWWLILIKLYLVSLWAFDETRTCFTSMVWMKQTCFISKHWLKLSSINRGSAHKGLPPILETNFWFLLRTYKLVLVSSLYELLWKSLQLKFLIHYNTLSYSCNIFVLEYCCNILYLILNVIIIPNTLVGEIS